LNARRSNRPQFLAAERGKQVHAQADVERLAGGRVDGLPGEPLLGELGEGDLAGVGIQVGPA
jgi:hypothetical protein